MEQNIVSYTPKGVCAKNIQITISDGIITEVDFTAGCEGNHQGLARLCIGRTPKQVAESLKGITCGERSTSCPDQLALALETVDA